MKYPLSHRFNDVALNEQGSNHGQGVGLQRRCQHTKLNPILPGLQYSVRAINVSMNELRPARVHLFAHVKARCWNSSISPRYRTACGQYPGRK